MPRTDSRLRGEQNRTGLAPKDLARHIRPGAVFLVADETVDFPAERMAGAGPRDLHRRRPIIILQSATLGPTKDPRTVLAAPVSASSRVKPAEIWNVPIIAAEQPLNDEGKPCFDKDGVAFVSLCQPFLKSDLDVYLGRVAPNTLDALFTAVRVVLAANNF